MSFDDQIRPAFSNLEARLRRDVARHLDAAIEELHERAQKIAETSEQQQAALIADAARQARIEAEEAAQSRLAAAIAQVEETAHAKLATALADAEAAAQAKLAAALADAERVNSEKSAVEAAATERTINERTAGILAEAERQANERVNVALADAGRQALEQVQRVRDEAARETANAERTAEERLQTLLKAAEQEADARVTAAQSLAASEALGRAQETFRQLEVAAGQRLASAFRGIDAAQSLSDILAALATAASAEVPRVAVLLTNGTEVRSWRFLGFEPTLAPDDSLTFPPADAGIVAEAHAQRQPVGMGADRAGSAPVFAELPAGRRALAVPVVVNGEAVAVLYADEGIDGGIERAAWPAIVEVLARHAARALEAVTAHRLAKTLTERRSPATPRPVLAPVPVAPVVPMPAASIAPVPMPIATTGRASEPKLANVVQLSTARPPSAAAASTVLSAPTTNDPSGEEHAAAKAYAQELVSGIRFRNEAQLMAAMRDRDLMGRLGPEIARAWSLYEARVPQSIRTNTNYFHSEMVRTLADGDATLLSPTP